MPTETDARALSLSLLLLSCAPPGLALLSVLLRQHRQLRQADALLQELDQGVLQLHRDGRVARHNRAAAELLGCAGRSLRGEPVQQWLPQPLTDETQVLARGSDGQQRSLRVTRLASGHLLLRPLQTEAERFQRSQYFARIGTWDWDIDTNRLYWSEAIYAMFGHPVGAVTPSYELFCQSVHPDDREHVRAGELRCIETGENHDEEYRVIWPDGTVRWLRETGNVIKDANGTPVKMMGVVRDITEEKAWASQMHRLAHHDPLTGLPNRLVFEERLGNALERARCSASRVALVFIDLNGFKAINDRLGHRAGDQVLVTMAARLREALRGSDSVARLGGDEFVAILEGLSPAHPPELEGQAIAGKLLAVLSPPVPVDDSLQQIGTSLGIALFPEHAQSMDRLIHIADQAMYAAKRSGDNQYRLGQVLPLRAQGE
jgi:diguanylate cyclase (GGDEF)-like protein/PAS domain S-box-containing protein